VYPYNFPESKAEEFLNQKSTWIYKHATKNKINSGYHYFGKKVYIIQQYNLFAEKPRYKFDGKRLIITTSTEDSAILNDLWNIWLYHTAKKYITKRVQLLSRKHGFNPGHIRIKNQITRWGSCSTKGNLNFNYKLISFPKRVIDYVIIHELCHLKEMNHSDRFWKLVENYIPDYKILKKKLRS